MVKLRVEPPFLKYARDLKVTITIEWYGRKEEGSITIDTIKEPDKYKWCGEIVSLFMKLLNKFEEKPKRFL